MPYRNKIRNQHSVIERTMHHVTSTRFLRSALLTITLFATGCAVNPATGEFDFMLVSEAEEKTIGERAHSQITAGFGGIYDDKKFTAYFDSVGQRLAAQTELPDLGYKFTILDSPIVNAFAAPGGYVYVTRGLLALPVSESQLAAVLGHELGHINARHTAQRVTLSVAQAELCKRLHCDPNGALLKRFGLRDEALHLRRFSREQEFEADELAVRYLTRAGYPASAMRSLLRTLLAHGATKSRVALAPSDGQRPDHMSTHPLTAARLDQATIVALRSRTSASRSDDGTYLAAVDGLLYGNRADVGFVTGRQFANPDRRITFDVPEGFVISATRDQVAASGPGDSSIIFEAARAKFTGNMLEYLTTLWARDFSLEESHTTVINGMDAAIGWARRETDRGSLEFRLVAIRFDQETIYRFLTIAPSEHSETFAKALRDSIFSFRRLGVVEAGRLKPRRLRIVDVQAGDSLSDFVQRMAVPELHWEQFAILNGLFDAQESIELKPGAKLKLITR